MVKRNPRDLLERIRQSPKTVRPAEMCRLLEAFGYQRRERKVRGSHLYFYKKPGQLRAIGFQEPHPGKYLPVGRVKRILRILKQEEADAE